MLITGSFMYTVYAIVLARYTRGSETRAVTRFSSAYRSAYYIYATINFTSYSVTEVGGLSAAGWAWSLHGKPEWQAGRNGSVRLNWGRSGMY